MRYRGRKGWRTSQLTVPGRITNQQQDQRPVSRVRSTWPVLCQAESAKGFFNVLTVVIRESFHTPVFGTVICKAEFKIFSRPMITTVFTWAAVSSKGKYEVQNPVYTLVVNKGQCIRAETDNELNGDTNLFAKLRKQRKNGLTCTLTDLRFLQRWGWGLVLGLLRWTDWQLPPFRSRIVPASFRVKQKALRCSETPVTFEPVGTVRTSEDSPVQNYFCKNLKYWTKLNLERWNITATEMPHEYAHSINTLWIATIAKNCFYVVTM
jgi:hypothetical protein